VASGDGGDYSYACVWRIGNLREPDTQVAAWHGLMDPSHYAKALAALGVWYHSAEIAVEYNGYGITTGNDLRWAIDYPNLYRWKHLDKVTNSLTLYFHWMTTSKTRPEMINRFNQGLIDHTVIIRDKHLIEEMRDFGREEGQIKVAGIDNNDDMVMGGGIGLCALRERLALGGQLSEGSTGAADSNRIKPAQVYGIYDQFSRQMEQVDSEEAGYKRIRELEAKHKVSLKSWKVKGIQMMKANTPWSEAYMGSGAEHELWEQHGVNPKDQLPDMVSAYKTMLTHKHYQGEGLIEED
jgi:hypothetical protein